MNSRITFDSQLSSVVLLVEWNGWPWCWAVAIVSQYAVFDIIQRIHGRSYLIACLRIQLQSWKHRSRIPLMDPLTFCDTMQHQGVVRIDKEWLQLIGRKFGQVNEFQLCHQLLVWCELVRGQKLCVVDRLTTIRLRSYCQYRRFDVIHQLLDVIDILNLILIVIVNIVVEDNSICPPKTKHLRSIGCHDWYWYDII